MFNPLLIDAPYDSLQFINNLQAYNASRGTDEMLDLMREIQQSGNYYWQGISFPFGDQTTVAGNATVNGTCIVPQGTYITSITHYDIVEEEARHAVGLGFKIKIWDKGSKASIFYTDYCLNRIVSSNMQIQYGVGANNPPTDQGSNLDNPFGPGYLMSPFIVNDPGVIGWEVVNLDPGAVQIQVMMACAVPINKQSTGQRTVDRGY